MAPESSSSSTFGPHSKVTRVCLACHSRKVRHSLPPLHPRRPLTFRPLQVSCDLLRPCTACIKYSRSKPSHVCEYGPDAAAPGEAKTQSGSRKKEEKALLMPARTRGASRALQAFVEDAGLTETEGEKEEDDEVKREEVEREEKDQEDDYKPVKNLPPLWLPTTYPSFPSSLPPLPTVPSPLPSPVIPYFTSVFASSPTPSSSPKLGSSPVLSPRPASTIRRPSLPDDQVLFDPGYVSTQRSFARLSISPPSTGDVEKPRPQPFNACDACGQPLKDNFDGIFAFSSPL